MKDSVKKVQSFMTFDDPLRWSTYKPRFSLPIKSNKVSSHIGALPLPGKS